MGGGNNGGKFFVDFLLYTSTTGCFHIILPYKLDLSLSQSINKIFSMWILVLDLNHSRHLKKMIADRINFLLHFNLNFTNIQAWVDMLPAIK